MSDIGDRELTVNGVTKTYKKWCVPLNIAPATLYRRIHYEGMSPEEAVKKRRVNFTQAGRRGRKAAAEQGFRFN